MIQRNEIGYSGNYITDDENNNIVEHEYEYIPTKKPVIKKITLLPFIPSISYTYRF